MVKERKKEKRKKVIWRQASKVCGPIQRIMAEQK